MAKAHVSQVFNTGTARQLSSEFSQEDSGCGLIDSLMGGISLPTLFFHDDESPLVLTGSQTSPNPRSQWGFPPFLNLLATHSSLLRSRLIGGRSNQGAELYLINPSKADREVHDADLDDSAGSGAKSYPPKASFPDTNVLSNQPTARQTLISGFANLTNVARKASQQVLKHPLAQEIVPHLPPAVRSLVNAPGEWDQSGRSSLRQKGRSDVASEFESARLYLARWARVVAEEGERARRDEVAGRASVGQSTDKDVDDLTSSLGVFSILTAPGSKRANPTPTRTPGSPITSRDWASFAAQGRDELYVRREIFRRGFSDSREDEEKRTRREGWEVLLGIVPWCVGGVGGGETGRIERQHAREQLRKEKRSEYERLKAAWRDDQQLKEAESWKEEWHRIDVSFDTSVGGVVADDRLIVAVRTEHRRSSPSRPRQSSTMTRRRKQVDRDMTGPELVKRKKVVRRD